MSQVARDRRAKVLAELIDRGQVSVADLSARLGVSDATVRRDLKALADEHAVELVHGGAQVQRDADYSFQAKQVRNIDAKAVIGRLAAALVPDGDLVFLDSGTTCAALAPHLAAKRGIQVVVNSARLALELKGVEVILIGGQYRAERHDTVGPLAHAMLGELRGYTAFVGADGLAADVGPSAADIESAHLHRLAVQNARETVLLVDHTKFAAPSLFRIAGWERIARVVTDQAPPAEWAAFFAERRIPVILPS